MFNIPMNTTGALSADTLLSLNNTSSNTTSATNQGQNAFANQQTQNSYAQNRSAGVNQSFNQNQNYSNNNSYNQNQSVQSSYAAQPAQNVPNYNNQPVQSSYAAQPVQNNVPNYNNQNFYANQQSVQNSVPNYNNQNSYANQQSVQNSVPNYNNQNSYANQQPVQNAQTATPKQRPNGGGVHLKKGQKTSLSQMNPNLSEIQVCLGWDLLNQACDLDASAFMLGADNKVVGDDWFVFYGQPTSPDGSIMHMGDSPDGAGAGDDEIINVNLKKLSPNVQKIVFIVTINEALERHLNFSMVSNAYVRVVDKSTNKELIKFMLTDYFSTVTSMVVGEVYNKGGQWRFNPVGNGFAEDLAGLCGVYGVNVAD